MKTLKYMIFPALLAFAGCSERTLEHLPDATGKPCFRLDVSEMQGDRSADSRIDDVTLYLFRSGVLEETIIPEHSGQGNIFSFGTDKMSGQIYVLANSSGLEPAAALVPGSTTLDEFLSVEATADEMKPSGFLMTGKADLDGMTVAGAAVRMTRSAARLDILTEDRDVRVMEVTVRGLAEKGPVHSGKAARQAVSDLPDTRSGTEFVRDFSDAPLHNACETLLYMVPQDNAGAVAEVTAEFGDALHRFRTALPETITRNTVYTLAVHGNGTGISVAVLSGDWESGSVSGSGQSLRGVVDVENSELPDGIRVSSSRDTVYVPYTGCDFVLSILGEPSAEVSVEGSIPGVEIVRQPSSRSLEKVASVSVSSSLRMPGSVEEKIYLDVHEGNVSSGRVVLVFESSPIVVDGMLDFGEDGVCDFAKYVDGELAVITMPSDKVLSVEFAAGEDPWMKAVETGTESGQRTYRILGGWKPNDPKADGRSQEGFVVISSEDGSDREKYTVRRLNYGLPVVKMRETWWCRYNLRGNVKDFSDQIKCGEDPAPRDALFEMLLTMPENDLLALMGDQYQAGNPDGLPLRHDGSAFYYEGMNPSALNFGLLDPSEMAPDGYMIPDYRDYAFFSASNDFNLGGIGSRQFDNMSGQRLDVRIAERNVSFLGHDYGTVAFYDFIHDGSHWTLFGLGHQWNTVPGNIAGMNILLATYGDTGRTWGMEGYSSTDRPGQNWIKFAANNTVKTRTIRCVKSPVEYIYD